MDQASHKAGLLLAEKLEFSPEEPKIFQALPFSHIYSRTKLYRDTHRFLSPMCSNHLGDATAAILC